MKTTSTLFLRALALCCGMLLGAETVCAQISMGSARNNYSQSFDELPLSGTGIWESGSYYLPGWAVQRTKPTNTIVANSGASNTGALYSYGTSGSTDRALGSISSANAGEFAYTLLLQNNTGSTINSIELSYTGEQWRISNSTAGQHVISVWYAVSSKADGFSTSPSSDKGWVELPEMKFYGPKYKIAGSALNGNAPENRRFLETILPVDVPEGHYLMLRWKDADELEHDHGLAIDDVVVSWYPEVVDNPIPLPVELASFKAKIKGERVELQWLTASEDRNSHFVVERSSDGKLFEGIGYVRGKGTTSLSTTYTFLDEAPLAGSSYYRLKQVDEDESYTYSSVVAVSRAVAQSVKVFPTITAGDLVVSGVSSLQQAIVVDMMGKKLFQQQLYHNTVQHKLDVSGLSSGTYVLVLLDADGKRHTSRFTKR